MNDRTQPAAASSPETRRLRRSLRSSWGSRAMHFARQYAEMVVAMFLGMFALGAPLAALLGTSS